MSRFHLVQRRSGGTSAAVLVAVSGIALLAWSSAAPAAQSHESPKAGQQILQTPMYRKAAALRGVAASAALAGLFLPVASQAQQPAASSRWAVVTTALGRAGAAQPGGVMKYSFPRSDLTVVVQGVTLKPALALGSWVAFREVAPRTAMMMGDLVLTEEEVAPVMRALRAGGVEQTALHNHLLMESPRVMYMHIAAHGDAARIAGTIRAALAQTHTPVGQGAPPATPSAAGLDTGGIARALGHSGKLSGDVYQVAIPRREGVMESGHEVPASMGVATSINFQPTGGSRAAISGDFVLRANEVNPVIGALLAHGIQPVAIHSHMLTEQPRLFFMHYWANDDAVTLAKGLRAALDFTASAQ